MLRWSPELYTMVDLIAFRVAAQLNTNYHKIVLLLAKNIDVRNVESLLYSQCDE